MAMKILQILPGITIGGPSVSVTSLSRHLSKSGHNVLLFLRNNNINGCEEIPIYPFRVHKFPFNNKLAFSYQLLRELKKECIDSDIIQTNSLWQYPNFVMEQARKGTRAKSVIVPRGTLSEYALSLSPLKKKLVLALGQRKALKNADMFIATCEKEYHDIRRFGLTQPVAIIPNGLDIPSLPVVDKKKTILFLARIHKIKGVDLLISAWRTLESDNRFKDWNLVIAGPTNSDYAKQVMANAHDLQPLSWLGGNC